MRIVILLSFYLIVGTSVYSQNLIANGSFETNDSCPDYFGEIHNALPWFQPLTIGSSTDYFIPCAGDPDLFTPLNFFGFQAPFNGLAYAGIETFGPNNLREYLETPIAQPLIAGEKYKLRFYFSLSDGSMYAINKLGAHFSIDSVLLTPPPYMLFNTPQIQSDTSVMITDTSIWYLFEEIYTAVGGENFVTIGNFFPDSLTNDSVINPGGYPWTYYYIDSVSLTLYDDTGIPPVPSYSQILVNNFLYPSDFFTATNLPDQSALNIYDSRGRIVYRNENYQNELSASQLPSGMYLYEFILPDQSRKTGKLVVE